MIPTSPFDNQKAGTSGLRHKTAVWMQPRFVENYVQSILNATEGASGKSYVVGGDGRYFNDRAIGTILRILAANGAKSVIVGQNGLLSTPAASHLIRLNSVDGGFILSASHNPGGKDADFGLKYNMSNGGPATDAISDAIYAQTRVISTYQMTDSDAPDLSVLGDSTLDAMAVRVVDPVRDYAKLMESQFDFNAIQSLFKAGFRMRFDAMHAVTGPYATAILEQRLGAPAGTVINGTPLPDFGGGHPDPNPIWAKPLMDEMMGADAPDLGAASDGDGDRNMIVGRRCYVTPSDSLAVLAANATLVPAFSEGLRGVARSMPTSAAVDRVAVANGLQTYATPTGWKYFGNLLDAGRISLCGEESAGTGSDHIREKDGVWAVLFWLNIIAKSDCSVAKLMSDHWARYGRNYYSRHDYEAIEMDAATQLMTHLTQCLGTLSGRSFGTLDILGARDFTYDDPVDGSHASGQGIEIMLSDGARIVYRLSGTGTQGATLRVYLERYVAGPDDLDLAPEAALAEVAAAAHLIAGIQTHTGRTAPDVTT